MKNKVYIKDVGHFYDVGIEYLLYFRTDFTIEELYDFLIHDFEIRLYSHDTLCLLSYDSLVCYIHYDKHYDYYVLDISGKSAYFLYFTLIDDLLVNIYYYK